ncbi:putative legumin J [Sesbania bispinosa]|nr:putative legumin J [Sesbania bispinosa]
MRFQEEGGIFFCRIAGQGRQNLTHEFYNNGWKVKGEEWPQFTSFVRGKEPKPKALKMGDLLPIPRAVISKEMENIMLTKKKSLAYSSLITLLCLDAGVNLSDDEFPISAAKAISTRRISEYELAFQKKQPNVPSTSRPPPPRHQIQAEINQMILDNQVRILDNQVMIQSNQAVLALRQDVLYAGLRRGQILLAKNLIDIPGRVHIEAPSFLSSANLDDDLLGELLGHKAMPPFPAAGQSSRDKDNDDNEPTTS